MNFSRACSGFKIYKFIFKMKFFHRTVIRFECFVPQTTAFRGDGHCRARNLNLSGSTAWNEFIPSAQTLLDDIPYQLDSFNLIHSIQFIHSFIHGTHLGLFGGCGHIQYQTFRVQIVPFAMNSCKNLFLLQLVLGQFQTPEFPRSNPFIGSKFQ